MKAHTDNLIAPPSASLRSRLGDFLVAAAILLLLISARSNAGILAEWQANPLNGNWNNNANWSPAAPNGPSDAAFFEPSSITNVSISANTQVAGIVFDSGASAFTITATPALFLTISGNGITNNSGITQNFVTAGGGNNTGAILFANSATAGSMTVFTNNNSGTVSGALGGLTQFDDTSTAGSATITNNGGTVSGAAGGVTNFFGTSTTGSATLTNDGAAASSAASGETEFDNTSTAGSATLTNNGAAVSGAAGGLTDFFGTSTAGSATLTNNGGTVSGAAGGETDFSGTSSTAGSATITNNGGTVSNTGGGFTEFSGTSSTAGSATLINNGAAVSGANAGATEFDNTSTAGNGRLIANGGVSGAAGGFIFFADDSAGGTARVKVFGNGNLDISFHNAPGVTIGSIEGTGNVFLGANNLTVGSNKLSTTFSGVMQDGGVAGSLTKIGKGKLTLTTANIYTGATTVNGGTLLVKNKAGSGTGTGAVQVNIGTLGGTGIISGAVTVGNGSSAGAILLGGNSATAPGTLTMNNTLTFNSLSTYKCVLNRTKTKASKVSALGVTINSNVPFTFVDTGTGTLATGTVFTVLNNTSASLISGRFSNLANGATFTSNGNSFKVNYKGGTGNDLTLTVVQ